jgi:DNA sulfur modification protein DndB
MLKRAARSAQNGEHNSPPLSPLLQDRDQPNSEARLRRESCTYRSIHPADEAKEVAEGWEVHQRSKAATKLKRSKPHHQSLEDRFWHLCFKMGYPILSGPHFSITYRRKDNSVAKKQIDVFAKDDETCLVVECKSRESRGRRDLQKEIHETEALQKALADSIRLQFPDGAKLKIIWMYVTQNIIWSEPDLDRARSTSIRVITENDLSYFETFAGHLGSAARHQFLAEFLVGQEIPGLRMKVPAVKGAFGPHKFYSFTISAKHLLKIAFVNHLALNHPGSRPAYQRMISRARIRTIREFIRKGGFFPTNILLNFSEECVFDQISPHGEGLKFGWLHLPNKYKSAWIIDGQHRLYGFTDLEEKFLESTLFVLAFERLDHQKEAELFVTINHEQKSVRKDLLLALQADLRLGSDKRKKPLVR